jgi:hypothetical protein
LTADIENADNIERRSTSSTTTPPTVGFEIFSTIARVTGNTIALGGLDVAVAARVCPSAQMSSADARRQFDISRRPR